MSQMEVLFFDKGGPLLVAEIKRDGDSIYGLVENGAWRLHYSHGPIGRMRCYSGSFLVNEVPTTLVRTVEIPAGMKGDYNELITWAEGQ